MKVNPNDWKTDGDNEQIKRIIHEGRKILSPIAIGFKESFEKNVLEITYVVVEDLEDSNDVGIIHSDKFYLTENATWKIGKFAAAMGCEIPFDPERMEDIISIVREGKVFKGTFAERTYNEKTYLNIKYYNVARSSKVTDQQKEVIAKAVVSIQKMIDKRIEYGDIYHKIKFLNSFDEQVQPHDDKNIGGEETNESWEELPF